MEIDRLMRRRRESCTRRCCIAEDRWLELGNDSFDQDEAANPNPNPNPNPRWVREGGERSRERARNVLRVRVAEEHARVRAKVREGSGALCRGGGVGIGGLLKTCR